MLAAHPLEQNRLRTELTEARRKLGGQDLSYDALQALPWLDAYPNVVRYAYFYDGPGYLVGADGSGLSARGLIYNSYTAACGNWNNTAGHC